MIKNMIKNTEAKLEKLYEIQDLIGTLTYEKGIETFLIKYISPKTGVKEFTVYGLAMEIAEENDGTFIMFSDMQKTIMNNCYILMGFMSEQIKKVEMYKNEEDHNVVNLELLKGTKVIIEALPDVQVPDEVYEAAMAIN